MYPNRDFRYLINQTNVPESMLIRSLGREPFHEVLHYWTTSQKPDRLLHIYRQGIEDAIARDRYPLYQLQSVESYPEFWISILNGLKRLWVSLRFSLDSESLLIDTINGQNINMTPEDKLQVLQIIPFRIYLTLMINNTPYTTGLLTSKRAEHIYQQVNWLTELLY